MIQRSTDALSTEDIGLLQGLKKKDHVVCYIIAIPFALVALFLFYRWFSGNHEGGGVSTLLFSGAALFIIFAGWYMQRQQGILQAYIDQGEKTIITGTLHHVAVHGYDRLRYRFENNTAIEVYLPLNKLHKRPLQSVSTIKDCIVTLQITGGDKPILLHVNYAGNPAATDLQPATDEDRRKFLKGQAAVVWIMAGCLTIVLFIVGIYSKWSGEALVLCFGLPVLGTMFIGFFIYRYEKRLAAKMTERLTVSGKVSEIIVARVGSGKHSYWHYFYRIGPYTYDVGGVSKAIPGDDVRIDFLRMKNGKGQRIISLQLNPGDVPG